MHVDEPLALFPVCDVKVTGQMQLQHQDPGMFRTMVAGCCLYAKYSDCDIVMNYRVVLNAI